MKCSQCHKHYKPERNLDTFTTCPDCSQVYDNTELLEQLAKLNTLFEELLKRHGALAEGKELYREKLLAIMEEIVILAQKRTKTPHLATSCKKTYLITKTY